MECPRKTGLKNGLRQLTLEQLTKVKEYPEEMIFDTYNYSDGKFCALAVAFDLQKMEDPSQEKVFNKLEELDLKIFNTRGISGTFYTTNRKEDLFIALEEVITEKGLKND